MAYVGRPGLRLVEATGLTVRRHVEVLTTTERHSPAVSGMVAALKASVSVLPDPPGEA
jgi:hypothetical protein